MGLFRRRSVESEEASTYGEKHADRVIKRMDELTDDLEAVVKELKDISARRLQSGPDA